MIAVRTVVCPIDFSTATVRQVGLAIALCRAFGARLVLHHNVIDVAVGAAVGWMWHAEESEREAPASVDERMLQLQNGLPADIDAETVMTRGGLTETVLAVSNAADADLLVLTTHAGKSVDHASVIEFLLGNSSRHVLALHDSDSGVSVPRFLTEESQKHHQTVLVPVSLHTDDHAQWDFACDLARRFPVRLHLLHVIESPGVQIGTVPIAPESPDLRRLIPDDLRERVSVETTTGEVVPSIVATAKRLRAASIVMGEHTRVPVKRWFSHDTSRAVLHEAPCPVWYVPSRPQPVKSLSEFAISTEKSKLWGNV